MNKECTKILETLEHVYSGAKMMDDSEAQIRIARAIKAFELAIDVDCIIHNGCYCCDCKRCNGFYNSTIKPDEIGICKINQMAVGPYGYCNYGVPRD